MPSRLFVLSHGVLIFYLLGFPVTLQQDVVGRLFLRHSCPLQLHFSKPTSWPQFWSK